MTKEIKKRNASKVLGIVSIATGWLVPISGVVCGIVGLSIKKNEEHYSRDVALNTIGLIAGVIAWATYITYYL